jgi:hypothetical protein
VTEHAEPGGVSCATRTPSAGRMSTSSTKPRMAPGTSPTVLPRRVCSARVPSAAGRPRCDVGGLAVSDRVECFGEGGGWCRRTGSRAGRVRWLRARGAVRGGRRRAAPAGAPAQRGCQDRLTPGAIREHAGSRHQHLPRRPVPPGHQHLQHAVLSCGLDLVDNPRDHAGAPSVSGPRPDSVQGSALRSRRWAGRCRHRTGVPRQSGRVATRMEAWVAGPRNAGTARR